MLRSGEKASDAAGKGGADRTFIFGEWLVDPRRGELRNNDQVRKLEPKAMDVLVLLLLHDGDVISTNDILATVWSGRIVEEGAVHQRMSQIRTALGDHRDRPRYIESIPKRGYRTLQPVRLADHRQSTDSPGAHRFARVAPYLAAGLVLFGIAIGTGWWLGMDDQPPAERQLRQFTVSMPEQFLSEYDLWSSQGVNPVDVSPDSIRLVFHGNVGGRYQLYSRPLGALSIEAIAGTEGAAPIFDISPDGRWLAFVDYDSGALKKLPVAGGTPVLICDPDGNIASIHWGSPDTIVFDTDAFAGILSVSTVTGLPKPVTSPEGSTVHKHPHLLPDGRTVLFTIGSRGLTIRQADAVAAVSMDTGAQLTIGKGASAQFAPPETLLYFRDGVLWASDFDTDGLRIVGTSRPLVEGVLYRQFAHYSTSRNGTLAYVTSSDLLERDLVWVDLEGREGRLLHEQLPFEEPRISPQGDRIAMVIDSKSGADLWLYEIDRGTFIRLTFDESREAKPVWMPDGERLIYSSKRVDDLFLLTASTASEPLQLTDTPNYEFASSVTRDGRRVLFDFHGPESQMHDIGILDIDSLNISALLADPYLEFGAVLSPDEQWIAYASTRSGRTEIYVRPFPNVADRLLRVSRSGGQHPVWGSDERLYYWGTTHIMSVAITTGPDLRLAPPEELFSHEPYLDRPNRLFDFDRASNRFLMVKKSPEEARGRNRIVVVDNWRLLQQQEPGSPESPAQ